MEESSFQAIYTGTYIVVFIAALTTTLYLFNGITTLADTSYEYGNIVTGQSVIEAPSYDDLNLNGSEIISYYFNYVKKDKYADDTNIPQEFSTVNFNTNTGISNNNYSYSQLINNVRNKNNYIKVNSENNFSIVKK